MNAPSRNRNIQINVRTTPQARDRMADSARDRNQTLSSYIEGEICGTNLVADLLKTEFDPWVTRMVLDAALAEYRKSARAIDSRLQGIAAMQAGSLGALANFMISPLVAELRGLAPTGTWDDVIDELGPMPDNQEQKRNGSEPMLAAWCLPRGDW